MATHSVARRASWQERWVRTFRSALAACLLAAGIAAALGSKAFGAEDAAPSRGETWATRAADRASLAALALTDGQREEIQRIEAREAERLIELRRALTLTELDLRREELARPYDEKRVNFLVARQAEIRGYLRGAESRMVSEIAALLSEGQRRTLEELRLAPAPQRPAAQRSAAPSESTDV